MLRTVAELRTEMDEAIVHEIEKGLDLGMSRAEIARALGVTSTWLCKFLKRMGMRIGQTLTQE